MRIKSFIVLTAILIVATSFMSVFVYDKAYADGINASFNINTTNGPIAIIRINSTNDKYEVQYNPNNIDNGWQTVYVTTNLAQAIRVAKSGFDSLTNNVTTK